MPEFKNAVEIADWMVRYAKEVIEPYHPEWAERRETAKTLISLASAALIFTITFSSSIITPNTSQWWRYTLLVCWIAFVLSLACALGSLWFAMGLASLPILVDEKKTQIVSALNSEIQKQAKRGGGSADPAAAIFAEQMDKVAKDDRRVYWLLRISVLCFAVALIILTAVGVRQLLN